MSVFKHLKNYYENYDEENRLLRKYSLVEYLTTMRYIEKYLSKGMKVCEIGAGTGRYSHVIANMGYSVDAVELIEHNIKKFEEKINNNQNITIRQGDAKDLSCFDNEQYDITLLLGPLYHLFSEEGKIQALSEAMRITKQGGIVFVAYCMADASIIDFGFRRGNIFDLIEKKMIDTQTFETNSNPEDIFELVIKSDIDRLDSNFNVKRLHYVAADGYSLLMRDEVENMDDKTFELYMKYHFTICEREDMVGITHHVLDILKKL